MNTNKLNDETSITWGWQPISSGPCAAPRTPRLFTNRHSIIESIGSLQGDLSIAGQVKPSLQKGAPGLGTRTTYSYERARMISLNQSFPFKLWRFEIRDESASELPYLQIITRVFVFIRVHSWFVFIGSRPFFLA